MKVELHKEINNPLIIEGFPGFGLVSTITVEYLINNLNTELVGKVSSDKLPPMIAVHDGKVVEPIGVFYNSEYNVLFVYSMLNPKGIEWEVADMILDLSRQTNARGIISLEGINKVTEQGDKLFAFCTNKENEANLTQKGLETLKEGIILGVTSTLLARNTDKNIDCIFVETDKDVPDSMGAAKLVEILDKFVGFNIDTEPLKDAAKMFEGKIKKILENSKQAVKSQTESQMNYVG